MRAKSIGTTDSSYVIVMDFEAGRGFFGTDFRVAATSAGRAAAIHSIGKFFSGWRTEKWRGGLRLANFIFFN